MKFGTGVVFTEIVDPVAVSPKQNRPNDSRSLHKGIPALSTFTVKKPYRYRFWARVSFVKIGGGKPFFSDGSE
jgi:hypothetical protein